ncbi:hypothetical protein BGZ65_002325, partial [Modicella reniformis]
MYGGANPMRMGAYGQMSSGGQFRNQYGSNSFMYQQCQASGFVAPYNNVAFQPSFAASGSAGTSGVRTIYMGNVPPECTIDEVLNLVHSGLVESARLLPEKNCAFISFMDPNAAASFHRDGAIQKFRLAGREVRVGWGKPSSVPPQVLQAVQQGATRNVFLGGVDDSITEDGLRADFADFGTIDKIKIMREKNIAFVHFTSIASAMKAVANLSNDPRHTGRRLNYGKDRCAKQRAGTTPGGVPGSFTSPGYTQLGGSMAMPFSPPTDGFSASGRVGTKDPSG